MTVPLTQEYVKPEEKLVKHTEGYPGDQIKSDRYKHWGDGVKQCFFYHLELGLCENSRCYYYTAPADGSQCTGYVNCPIYKRIKAGG